MHTLINGETHTCIWIGQRFGWWTLAEIVHTNPDAPFGTHMFKFVNGTVELITSNQHWAGDTWRCKSKSCWVRCPKAILLFSDRHTKVIEGMDPLTK